MIKIDNPKTFKFFVLKLLAFFIVVYSIDLLIGYSLKKYYFRQEAGYDFQTTYSLEKTNAEMLIFGSSRAVNVFDPEKLGKSLGVTCYNVGRYGEPVFYHYAILKGVLKRYKPTMVLLSFDAGNFSKNQESYDRLSVLLPYYSNHPEIRSIVALKGPFEKLKLLSNIYPYNSLLLSTISGNMEGSKIKYYHSNGFVPLEKTFKGPLQTFDYTKEAELDTAKINIFKSFLQDCINSNIQLFIFCPPYMINPIGTDHSIIAGKRIAEEYHIKFFDYSRDTFFTNKSHLFADFRHLNNSGVELFSYSVGERILESWRK